MSSSPDPDPWWKRIGQFLLLAGRDFLQDNGPSWAAAVAYYSLLSVFPLLLAVGSIAAFFVDPQWAVHQVSDHLGNFLPKGGDDIERIVRKTLSAGRGGGLFSILVLLWTGSLVFATLTKALNVAYDTAEKYGILKRTFVRLLMLLTVGLLFLFALSAGLVIRVLWNVLSILPVGREIVFALVVNAVPAVLLLAAFTLTYRLVPQRRPGWRAAGVGAAVATLLFLAAKPLFLGYVQTLARYNVIYGSLAGIIIVVLWAWIVAMITLFGGQISAHGQAVFIEGQSLEAVRRAHLDRTDQERQQRERQA